MMKRIEKLETTTAPQTKRYLLLCDFRHQRHYIYRPVVIGEGPSFTTPWLRAVKSTSNVVADYTHTHTAKNVHGPLSLSLIVYAFEKNGALNKCL